MTTFIDKFNLNEIHNQGIFKDFNRNLFELQTRYKSFFPSFDDILTLKFLSEGAGKSKILSYLKTLENASKDVATKPGVGHSIFNCIYTLLGIALDFFPKHVEKFLSAVSRTTYGLIGKYVPKSIFTLANFQTMLIIISIAVQVLSKTTLPGMALALGLILMRRFATQIILSTFISNEISQAQELVDTISESKRKHLRTAFKVFRAGYGLFGPLKVYSGKFIEGIKELGPSRKN